VLGVSEMVGRRAVLPALQRSRTATLVAIASRDAARANDEAKRFKATRSYGSYNALLDDPEVEAVYIPLPNGLHREWTIRAAESGKHVLCEKPLACSAAEAMEMADACTQHRVLLLEAYMTPYHRRTQAVLEVVRNGTLGDLRFGHSTFTFPNNDPTNHRWLPDLGGGALLDVGVYCLAPLVDIGGEPQGFAASQVLTPGGVDASFSGWLDFGNGFTATFTTSFEAPEHQLLQITGTEGTMSVSRAFTAGPRDRDIVITRRDGMRQVLRENGNDPYQTMVEHFGQAVRYGTPLWHTPDQSVRLLALMDGLRQAAQHPIP
jgi:predicted dehydrogenase